MLLDSVESSGVVNIGKLYANIRFMGFEKVGKYDNYEFAARAEREDCNARVIFHYFLPSCVWYFFQCLHTSCEQHSNNSLQVLKKKSP